MNSILLVLFNDSLGGAEQYLKMVAHHFLKEKQEVYVLFFTRKNDKGWEDLESYPNFHPTYGKTDGMLKGAFTIIKRTYSLRKIHFKYMFSSHVHINGSMGILRGLKFVKTTNFVARESTSIFKRFSGLKLFLFKMQYKIGYPQVDLLICQSDYMKEQLLHNLPSLSSKMQVEVFNNPVSLEHIASREGGKADLMEEGFHYIVSAGRLISEKGFDLLISAFSKVKKQHSNFRLMILGEGKLREQLEAQVESLKLTNDVFLPGFVANVYPYFKKAAVCVVSSRIEGFPNVLLQMMSQNHKVVSTLCAGGIENIKGVRTVETESDIQLFEGINEVIVLSSDQNKQEFQKELKRRSIDSFIKRIAVVLKSN